VRDGDLEQDATDQATNELGQHLPGSGDAVTAACQHTPRMCLSVFALRRSQITRHHAGRARFPAFLDRLQIQGTRPHEEEFGSWGGGESKKQQKDTGDEKTSRDGRIELATRPVVSCSSRIGPDIRR